jgi:hypothetical protein
MAQLHLDKFARICGLLGSDKEGEQLAALAAANRLLAGAGMQWGDFIAANQRAEDAEAVAKMAIAESNQLRARIADLERRQPDWGPVEIPPGRPSVTAEWVLQLNHHGWIWLSGWETDFLHSVSRWRGSVTPKMAPHLQRILDRVLARTGQTPPL